ncbi:MAG TPA: EscU/YscU/HrcU family type III secretion system export apparatus switch protein [Gemmatimonadaceae bacterium]|nr:EscU/YscU/HrcU family type III secretion system export apparatus switch protein [Gemmatimonadaceae bacterium]
MSEQSESDRTEEATPRKREEARDEGRIPRSPELTVAMSLLGSALVLSVLTPVMGHGLLSILGHSLASVGSFTIDGSSATSLIRETAFRAFTATIGLVLAMSVAPFAIATLQARGVFSLKPITPQFSRISPATNIKNLVGLRPIVELLKSLIKLGIVAAAVWASLKAALPDAISLSQLSQLGFLFVAKKYVVRMLATAGGAYLTLAGADYLYQWWQHEKSLRMTKEEVKLEMKQQDGDPQIKQRRRAVARSYARRQMMQDVPKADVIIVNPTHIAIAIKYDPSIAPAPIVLAIGQRKIAERIKAIALESGVPIVQNKPLARALLKTAKVGTLIPYELYMAVAEILAFVIRSRGTRGSWQGSTLA